MIRQALVLAGGLGTRLGNLTRDTPKPMIPVGEKPFLEHLLRHLSDQGVTRFILCIGYLAQVIQNHFGDGSRFGWQVTYSVEDELLGTGGAIKKASNQLQEAFMVISGDNYLELDYQNLFKSFLDYRAVGILSCWTNDPPLFTRNVFLDEKTHQILDYDYKDSRGKNFVDVGVKVFSNKLIDYFPSSAKFSLEVDVLPKIVKDNKLFGFPVQNPPLDVGTLEGLETVRKTLSR